jgi:hypothetical protein
MGDPNWGANNSPASGSYSGVVDRVWGGAPSQSPLGPFPVPTFIRVTVSGTVSQQAGAFPGSNIVRNAYAAPNDPGFWGAMGFYSGGGVWYATAAETILRTGHLTISPFRNDAGGQPTGDGNHCGWAGYALCWTWAGSANLQFERIHVDLTLVRSPDSTTWKGTSATFTAGMSQTYFPPNPYPVDLSGLEWRWLSDSAGTADTVACHSASGITCTHVFTTSGTMYGAAYVNGEAQQKSIHVAVQVPTLTLTAEKPTVVAPGESDAFTATGNGPLVVQGWSFTPDSLGGPAPTVGVGSSWGSCVPAVSACSNMVTHAGTVMVIGTVRGVQLTAEAKVGMVPPKITLQASKTSLLAHDMSLFTAVANSTPLDVQGWAFRPDGGSGGPATIGSSWGGCIPGRVQCAMIIRASGTVFVIGTVAGYASGDSVHLSVVPADPSGCPTGSRSSTNSSRLAPRRTNDCVGTGNNSGPQPGEDVGDDGVDCAATDSTVVGMAPTLIRTLMLGLNTERLHGPRAETDEPEAFCLLNDDCLRDATRWESYAILGTAAASGEWFYTQGGDKGGDEPAVNIPARYGDCTDFTWNATREAFGSGFDHPWSQKMSTHDLRTFSAAQLRERGYRRVPADSAWAGDIIVRGDHAGIFIEANSEGRVMGLANNGSPARPLRPNQNGPTAPFDFTTKGADAPMFLRALVKCL